MIRGRGKIAWVRRQRRLRHLDTIGAVNARSADFGRLRQEIRRMGTDDLAHFGNGYLHEGGLALQQHPDEFAALCIALLERGPYDTYLEIGSGSGGQCLALYRAVGFGAGLVIDDGTHPRALEQDRNFEHIPALKRFVGDSHSSEAASFLAADASGGLDLVFVDGDHSYHGVRQDLGLARPFCRAGTLVVLHDTVAEPGVERAWRELVADSGWEALGEYVGRQRPLGIGLARVCE